MAQKRFLNWKDAVKTFEIGEANLGKLQPGRYAGFDSIISAVGPTSGVLIDLIHTTTGFDKTLENGSQTSNNAALIMPTGTIIHEDAPITSLDIESNLTNPDYRYDYIICEHEYVQSVGGTPATYSVIKGPLLAALPTIPNPDKQILIGVVRVDPFNDTTFSGLTYTKQPVPLLGNESPQEFMAKLNLVTKVYVDLNMNSLANQIQDLVDALGDSDAFTDYGPNAKRLVDGETHNESLRKLDQASTPIGGIIMYSGSLAEFDGTGLGLVASDKMGWGLCNGNNGTPDLKGKFIVGYDPGDGDYDAIGKIGGEKEHTLTSVESGLPAHNVPYNGSASASANPGFLMQASEDPQNLSVPGANAAQPHENRPPYYTLAYIMRLS